MRLSGCHCARPRSQPRHPLPIRRTARSPLAIDCSSTTSGDRSRSAAIRCCGRTHQRLLWWAVRCGRGTRPGRATRTGNRSIRSRSAWLRRPSSRLPCLQQDRPSRASRTINFRAEPEQFSQRRTCFDHERRYAVCAGVRRGISRCLRAGVAAAVRRPRPPIVVRGRDIARRGDDRLANEVLRAGVRSRKMNLQVPLAATAVPVE